MTIRLSAFVVGCTLMAIAAASLAEEKPGLVLLPVQGPEIGEYDQAVYRNAVAKGFAARYTVFSGSEVDRRLQKTAKKVCDETQCLQDVAIQFQARVVARAIVVKEANGHALTVEARDIFDDRIVLAETRYCRFCDKQQIVDALQGLTTPRARPETLVAEEAAVQVMETGDASQAILIVETKPSAAEVWLGSTRVGETPYQNETIPPGNRVIVTLRKEGYKDKAVAVTLKPGFNQMEPVALQSEATGRVLVTTKPFAKGAQVWSRGAKLGIVPANVVLPVGEHEIEIRGDVAGGRSVLVSDASTQALIVDVESSLASHYRVTADGTVTDTRTGLQWMRCVLGQEWVEGECRGSPSVHKYGYTPRIQYAGHRDWRYPTLPELRSLIFCSSGKPIPWNDRGNGCDGGYRPPTLDQRAFPGAPAGPHWAESQGTESWSAMGVDFRTGDQGSYHAIRSELLVRLVRKAN